jgi:ABC-type sugar transport system ATPase subunit
VELVEHLGSEALVYVRIDDTKLIAKAPPDFQAVRGASVSLTLNNRGIHFFYKEQRIEVGV